MKEKNDKKEKVKRISTGCTLLDLVVGGGQGLGFPAGKIINIVGDKSSGKTFLGCEIIASNYYVYKDKLQYNYDDGESGFTFDTKQLYGIDIIRKGPLKGYTSHTIEDFDVNTKRFIKKIKSDEVGIYILDSLDGLSNEEIEERSEKRYKAAEQGKDYKEGTYGMRTPKFLSQEFFRTKTKEFREKDVILIIISQVRENIDPFSFRKFSRSGGKALDFYAHTALWLATVKKIKIKGRTVGVVIKARTDKSKTPRPFRECTFLMYFDYGIDNIGTNLDYLFDLRGKDGELKNIADNICWKGKEINMPNLKTFLEENDILDLAREEKKKETERPQLSKDWIIDWISRQDKLKNKFEKEFGSPMTREKLIEKIEVDPKMQKELEQRVIDKWEEIESSVRTNRKRKYS